MSGKGKYTSYVDPTERGKAKATRLGKAFPGSPFASEDGTPYDAKKALDAANSRGQALLRAETVEGNTAFGEVNMRYEGVPNGISAPDSDYTPESKAGAPLTRYVPNLKSPGAGPSGGTADSLGTTNLNPSSPGGEVLRDADPGSVNTASPSPSKAVLPPLGA
jgi:hypothetical protein